MLGTDHYDVGAALRVEPENTMPSQEMKQMVELLAGQPAVGGGSIEEQRAGMEAMLGGLALPENVTVNETRVGDMEADWVAMPNSANGRVVLDQ